MPDNRSFITWGPIGDIRDPLTVPFPTGSRNCGGVQFDTSIAPFAKGYSHSGIRLITREPSEYIAAVKAALALLEWICKLPVRPSREDEYRAAWDRWMATPPRMETSWDDATPGQKANTRAIVAPLLDRIDTLTETLNERKRLHSDAFEGMRLKSVECERLTKVAEARRVERNEMARRLVSTQKDLESKRDEAASIDDECQRIIRAQAIALDCEPEEIQERAEQLTAAQDRWYDFRTELCDALACEEAPGAIVAAVLDMKRAAKHDRAMREWAESATVTLAREVERLNRECDKLSGRKPRRGLFAMIASVLR